MRSTVAAGILPLDWPLPFACSQIDTVLPEVLCLAWVTFHSPMILDPLASIE